MEPDVGFTVIDRKQGSEGRQLFVVDVDEFADGDGVHGAAVFAFGGDGALAFAAVLAGDFGAFLFLFFGEDFLHAGAFLIRIKGLGVVSVPI